MSRQVKFICLTLLAIAYAAPGFARDDRDRPSFRRDRDDRSGPGRDNIFTKPRILKEVPEELRWILLGEQTVGFSVDRDTIRVGRQEGSFTRLRVQARTNDIYLYTMRVVFGNGTEQIVQVNALIQAGGRSAVFDLKGDQRMIRNITLNYKARPGFSGQTVVSVYGAQPAPAESAGGQGAGPDYPPPTPQVIDEQIYDRRADRIDFRIPRRDLLLQQLNLRAIDESVTLESIEVRYSKGPAQSFNIYDRLGPNEDSQPISIDGNRGFVTGVTVIKRPSFRSGDARLQLIGLERQPERAAQPRNGPIGLEQGPLPQGWVLFGSQTVGNEIDRDVIDVSRDIGQFGRIALSIRDAEVYVRQITLVYANGQRETRDIYKSIPANSRTQPIDIDGSRFLRQIELVYQSRLERRATRAVVEIYGEYDRRWLEDRNGYQNYNRGWLLLGAHRARIFSTNEDAFLVGARLGGFRALRLTAKRHTVRVTGIRITYTNGQTEELRAFAELADGQSTPEISLGRNGQTIERVDVRYRTKLNFLGEGLVELWGMR